jgi:hypothetical protein
MADPRPRVAHPLRSLWAPCTLALALAWPAAAPGQEAPAGGSRCGKGLLLVAEVDADAATKGLADLVAIRTEQGLRAGLDPNDPDVAALSVPGMERVDEMLAPALARHRSDTFGDRFKKAYEAALRAAKISLAPAGYVQVTLRREREVVSAELELVCLRSDAPAKAGAALEGAAGEEAGPPRSRSGPRLAARKVVRLAGATGDALLQAVFSAARRTARPDSARPVVRILGGGHHRVAVDVELVLDASSSSDPDDDAVELEWRLVGGGSPPGQPPRECHGWRQEGGRLYLRASAPTTCTFEVTAREVVDPQLSTTASVEVEVLGTPRLRVPERRILYAAEPLDVELAGECEGCARWRWSQVAGPLTARPLECSGEGVAARCAVRAPVPGEYGFALTGWNVLAEERRETSVIVVPPPVALAAVPRKAIVHHRYVLDGSGSHDPEGGELRYHWRVSRAPFPAACESAPPRDDVPAVRLATPTAARTEFSSATVARELHVRLTASSTRRFGDRTTTTVQCADRTMSVEAPVLWVALAGGTDMEAERQSAIGLRLAVVLAVRLFRESVPWLGGRFEQNLIRNYGRGTRATELGGTGIGLTFLGLEWLHPYLGAYFQTVGDQEDANGIQAGADFRPLRFLFASAAYRYEYPRAERAWRHVLTGIFGVGYNL